MRVFIAIGLPDDLKDRLSESAARLEPLGEGVKWVHRDLMHVTLAFLGEIAPAFLQHINSAVQKVCETSPRFSCEVSGYGFWGTKRNPTTVWAAVSMPPELEQLQERLSKAVKKFGFTVDTENFRPHITLGRCRESCRNRRLIEAMDTDENAEFGQLAVNKVTIYESRLGPKGPVYRTLMKFPLTAEFSP